MIKEKRIKNYLSDELINEWHPTKNKNLTPYDVSRGSGKIVWWECKKNHEWQARVGDRSKGKGCPYCSNRKVLKGFNDLTTTHPHLTSEWHPTKNKDITPDSVSYGSDKKVWWLCSHCNKEYERIISSQVKSKRCPKCREFIE